MNAQLLRLQDSLNFQKVAMLDMQKSLGGISSPFVSVNGFTSRLNCPEADPLSMGTPVAWLLKRVSFL